MVLSPSIRGAAASLTSDGLFTISYPMPGDKVSTKQFVYIFYNKGLILTDGEKTYDYSLGLGEKASKVISLHSEPETETNVDEMEETALEQIYQKTEDLTGELENAFKNAGISVTVNRDTGEMAMDASVLFGGDSAELTDEGKNILRKFIKVYPDIIYSDKYKDFISKTMVEGNTAPVDGSTYESGLPLSEERAKVVKDFCVSADSGVAGAYTDKLKKMTAE